jgi:hypothetical protein
MNFSEISCKKIGILENPTKKNSKCLKFEFMDKNDSEIIIISNRLFKSFLVFIENEKTFIKFEKK